MSVSFLGPGGGAEGGGCRACAAASGREALVCVLLGD